MAPRLLPKGAGACCGAQLVWGLLLGAALAMMSVSVWLPRPPAAPAAPLARTARDNGCPPTSASASSAQSHAVSARAPLPDNKLHPAAAAILLLNQRHELAVPVLVSVLSLLPPEWPVQIFTCDPLLPELATRLAPELARGKVQHTLMVKDKPFPNPRHRNRILTSSDFWELTIGKKMLMFDTTTVLCSNSPHNISEFMQYDWVGAPWTWAKPDSDFVWGGNGMFSLRTRARMLEITRANPYERGNEDMWFISRLRKAGAKLSPREVSMRFAVEEIYYPTPFGVSYGMRTVPHSKRAEILKNCPEARMLTGYLPGASWFIDEMKGESKCLDGNIHPPCPLPDNFEEIKAKEEAEKQKAKA